MDNKVTLYTTNIAELWSVTFYLPDQAKGFICGIAAALNQVGGTRGYFIRYNNTIHTVDFPIDNVRTFKLLVGAEEIFNAMEAVQRWQRLTTQYWLGRRAIIRISQTEYIIPNNVTEGFLCGLFTALTAFNVPYDSVLVSKIYFERDFYNIERLNLPKM